MIALIMYFCRAHWGSTRLAGAAEASKVWEASLGFTVNLEITADVFMCESEHVTVVNVSESAGMAQVIRLNVNEAAHYFKTLILNCVKDLTDGELLK